MVREWQGYADQDGRKGGRILVIVAVNSDPICQATTLPYCPQQYCGQGHVVHEGGSIYQASTAAVVIFVIVVGTVLMRWG